LPGPIRSTFRRVYNSLILEISCPYLGNRNNLYLQYNLSGLSEDWKQMPEDGTLNLKPVGAGELSLRVRKVNGFGKNNYQYRQWNIVVIPSFFGRPCSLSWAGLLVLALLVVLVQLRLKLVEKKKEIG